MKPYDLDVAVAFLTSCALRGFGLTESVRPGQIVARHTCTITTSGSSV